MVFEPCSAYVRVSTNQQAKHDLSIPDQLKQIREYAEQRGWSVVAEFIEPGASARDDQRPVLQDMIARALTKPPEFKKIVVHSMSRIFRDEMYYEWYRRKLDQNGVQIVSITQDFGEGPGADLTRRIMALTDEINSAETAKHVHRTMLENGRQNFWNGSAAPLGFRTVVAEIRGTKQKKRLEVEPEGAELIRLIFRLYLEGDGVSGPLGIKNIVSYLNDRGYLTPKGNRFHVSYVNRILRDEVYVGRAWYNKFDSRAKVDRPREEWIPLTVPAIVSEADFQRVAVQLTERSPKKTAPRLVNSPVLLTGVARCGGCGSLLHRQTGKGGTYTYYRCSGKRLQGTCEGGAPAGIAAPLLDKVVLDKVLNELLTSTRVQAIVASVAARREAGADQAVVSVVQLHEQKRKSTKKLENLINALAEGIVEATDTFKATVKATEADCERLANVIATQARLINAQLKAISFEQAEKVAVGLRKKLMESGPATQKRIIRSFVASVVVTADEIVIEGADSDLAEVVTGTPIGVSRLQDPVPTFERAWWSRGESNP